MSVRLLPERVVVTDGDSREGELFFVGHVHVDSLRVLVETLDVIDDERDEDTECGEQHSQPHRPACRGHSAVSGVGILAASN